MKRKESAKQPRELSDGPGKATKENSGRAAGRARQMVSVSALAVAAMKWSAGAAMAQTVKINCAGKFDIGDLIACDTGKYVITPAGATSYTGCLVVNTPGVAATCVAQTSGGPITKSLVLSISAKSFTMTPGGAGQVTVKNMKIQRRGSPTSGNPLTITSGAIAKTMTFDVGGTVHFPDKLPVGSYTGDVQITTKLN